jgi:type I restriction enzyme M protein
MVDNVKELAGFIWSVADLLRGDFKQSEYGKVILPFTVLRRLDCILEPNKIEFDKSYEEKKVQFNGNVPEPIIKSISKGSFYNISRFTFKSLLDDPSQIKKNIKKYIDGYSDNVLNIMGHFEIEKQIEKLESADLLYLISQKFSNIDLHPKRVSNTDMGYAFEELIRRFAELSNETAGEHFTPREVIHLMVNIIFNGESENKLLTNDSKIYKIYDPACGTGGMLSESQHFLNNLNTSIKTVLFGQEINPESSAICTSDMIIKGQNVDHIIYGDTLKNDGLADENFDYMLCNPPFGVEWKKQEKEVKKEYELQGYNGRFGAGLPRINDGSLLFLQTMLSKMIPVKKNDKGQEVGGSRIAIVFNGSPLFTGSAGSGESNIRKWIIENDWLESVIALPNDLFYNTGIATYIWVLTNRKEQKRKGKIQLINASDFSEKMRKSLGSKRNQITDDQIDKITSIYGKFEQDAKQNELTKIFDNDDFGYERITVERPLRLRFDINSETISLLQESNSFKALTISKKKGDAGSKEIEEGKKLQAQIINILNADIDKSWMDEEAFSKDIKAIFSKESLKLDAKLLKILTEGLSQRDEEAKIVKDGKGNPKADPTLRDNENVPLKEDIEEYFKREVLPHVPDAWIDNSKTVRGYEIPFTRHFYKYVPPRQLEEIESELNTLQKEILELMSEVEND